MVMVTGSSGTPQLGLNDVTTRGESYTKVSDVLSALTDPLASSAKDT
jgi:hypothetical protein